MDPRRIRSSGPYLLPSAAESLPAGRSLARYVETVVGQDISFAWHHFQAWAEAYEARFDIPGVGVAGTQAYYVEGKYKFTPQFFGSAAVESAVLCGAATFRRRRRALGQGCLARRCWACVSLHCARTTQAAV